MKPQLWYTAGDQFHLALFLMLDDCFSGEENQYGNYEPHNNGY